MNVVNAGSQYRIYGEDLKTYNSLPVGSYSISFNKMSGFSLISRPDLITNEEKIYGNHQKKAEKALRGYAMSNRNFGVILSGPKGIGKSLFVRVLAQTAIRNNLAVILVEEFIPGIAQFISSIEQDVVVIFDEFEKAFSPQDDGFNPQDTMLSLFDGMDNGHKLFVITCNDCYKLNDCLLNRPGRFHYHFTLENPTKDNIREYMTDKLLPEYQHLVERVVDLSNMINMTYDYLRAFAFEINGGSTIDEALQDLNITMSNHTYFTATVKLTDGSLWQDEDVFVDVFCHRSTRFRVYCTTSDESFRVVFDASEVLPIKTGFTVPADAVTVQWNDNNNDANRPEVASLILTPTVDDSNTLKRYRYLA